MPVDLCFAKQGRLQSGRRDIGGLGEGLQLAEVQRIVGEDKPPEITGVEAAEAEAVNEGRMAIVKGCRGWHPKYAHFVEPVFDC